ncbi:DUF2157 domain-containing protein [Tepidamorphus sp. 3E244]|uniref:DUF2157 domain-containing protein n=1 Tax=Tepidamorphus sp. 3E244 TaxID=3385498 RepID=UPI0038FD0AE7
MRYVEKAIVDVERWAANGWVSGEGLAAIRQDLAARRSRFGLPHIFVFLGAVLLAASVLTFVAANWEEIPRTVRLFLLAGTLVAAHGVALWPYLSGEDAFGQSALIVACGVYGASIMLVAQMYHLDGNPTDAVLAWALGCTLCCLVYRASAVWVFAFAVFCLWSGGITADRDTVHWLFPLICLGMAVLAWWIRFTGARHLLALAMTVWVVTVPLILDRSFIPYQTTIIGAVVAALGAAIMLARPRGETVIDDNAPLALMYGYAVAFAGLFNLQFLENPDPGSFIVMCVLALALSLAVLAIGREHGRGMAIWVAYLGFSIEVVGIYFETVGTLVHTSLFFFTAGLIVIALAWLGVKLRRAPRTEDAA